MMHGGEYGWGMGFGWFFTLIFWGLIIFAIFYLVKHTAGGKKEGSALDILKKRYAAGEISREEFERMKEEITQE